MEDKGYSGADLTIGDLDDIEVFFDVAEGEYQVFYEYESEDGFESDWIDACGPVGLWALFYYREEYVGETYIDLYQEVIDDTEIIESDDGYVAEFSYDYDEWARCAAANSLKELFSYDYETGLSLMDLLSSAAAYYGNLPERIETGQLADIVLAAGANERSGAVLYSMGEYGECANDYFSIGYTIEQLAGNLREQYFSH